VSSYSTKDKRPHVEILDAQRLRTSRTRSNFYSRSYALQTCGCKVRRCSYAINPPLTVHLQIVPNFSPLNPHSRATGPIHSRASRTLPHRSRLVLHALATAVPTNICHVDRNRPGCRRYSRCETPACVSVIHSPSVHRCPLWGYRAAAGDRQRQCEILQTTAPWCSQWWRRQGQHPGEDRGRLYDTFIAHGRQACSRGSACCSHHTLACTTRS
jgi:hypothetical protein